LSRRQSARQSLIGFTEYTYPDYRAGAHHRLIAEKLQAVIEGRLKRLMIFMPPRHGKTLLTSRRFPAWYLGRFPDRQIIATSYNTERAREYGRDVRNVIASPDYRALFPGVSLAPDSKAADLWHTNKGGVYIAAGIGAGITGMGADVLLIDDPIKDRADAESATIRNGVWDWYTSTAYTRLMPGGAVVVIQTRWHYDDLAGRLLAAQESAGDRWDVLSLPATDANFTRALWPEQFPLAELRQIQIVLGERDWSAMYQQQPAIEGGNIYKRDWWRAWPREMPLPDITYLLQVWDTAYEERESGDYNACTIWGVSTIRSSAGRVRRSSSWAAITSARRSRSCARTPTTSTASGTTAPAAQ
jgi:hypothetical protein